MKLASSPLPWKWIRLAVGAAVLIAAGLTWRTWWLPLQGWVRATTGQFRPSAAADAEGSHTAPAGSTSDDSIEVSPQAMRNLGLTPEYLKPVRTSTFRRSIRVPAVVVEQPSRTHIQVATPMTGIVTRVHVVSGEAIQPGRLLFSLRLTHEDLVNSQTEFLKTLGEVDVERLELERLRNITSGVIPPNLILERQYAVQKLEARLKADREALLLHGLSEEQVQGIENDRKLLRTLEVYAPAPHDRADSEYRITGLSPRAVSFVSAADDRAAPQVDGNESDEPVLILENLLVHQGQALNAGESLCVLADYSRLFIEGLAFERDGPAIVRSRERGWPLSAYLSSEAFEERIDDLQIAFIANEIDVQTRTLHFYVNLSNTLLPQPAGVADNRFVNWKFRPGQRLELAVPVEEWTDQIVLPVEAVAREGAESFVFLQNGRRFDRRAVHVKYRDQSSVVVAHDGAIFPGDILALRGAYQLQMAIKNKSGGGVDPHAGHTH